jgi:hypothetical protein
MRLHFSSRYSLFYLRRSSCVCILLCTTFVYLTCNRLSPTDIVYVCCSSLDVTLFLYIIRHVNVRLIFRPRALITAYRYKREKIAACLVAGWCSSFIPLWGDYLLLNADYNRIHTCSSSTTTSYLKKKQPLFNSSNDCVFAT